MSFSTRTKTIFINRLLAMFQKNNNTNLTMGNNELDMFQYTMVITIHVYKGYLSIT